MFADIAREVSSVVCSNPQPIHLLIMISFSINTDKPLFSSLFNTIFATGWFLHTILGLGSIVLTIMLSTPIFGNRDVGYELIADNDHFKGCINFSGIVCPADKRFISTANAHPLLNQRGKTRVSLLLEKMCSYRWFDFFRHSISSCSHRFTVRNERVIKIV